jgi:uncharacterized membrane protein YkoI
MSLISATRRFRAVCCFAAALATLVMGSAHARPVVETATLDWADPQPRARLVQRGGGISLQQATAIALSRFQGRVVRAETVGRGGRPVHEIRILGDDGRVRTVRIDAQSGEFL